MAALLLVVAATLGLRTQDISLVGFFGFVILAPAGSLGAFVGWALGRRSSPEVGHQGRSASA